MELQTVKKHIKTTEMMVEEVSEQALDCDLLLPDYLPDIAAVLKCITQPTVQNYQLSGDRVMVEGVVKVQILYLDEDRMSVHTFETLQPFGCSFILKENSHQVSVQLTAKTNYTNCRAISPRRADIHGTFTVKLLMYGEKERFFSDVPSEKAFQTREQQVIFSSLIGSKSKTFTVSETLELANTVEAHTLLRSSAVAYVSECKAIKDKAIIKGEILIKNVYALEGETGKLGSAENTIPFSQIVDLDGMEEESICFCRATVLHCEAHPAQTPVGENKLLSVSVKVNVDFGAFCEEEATVLTDVYHTDFLTKMTVSPMAFCRVCGVENRLETRCTTLDLPDKEIAVFEDVWCDIESVSEVHTEDEKGVHVQVSVCMLGRDTKNCLSFFERSVGFLLEYAEQPYQNKTNVKIYRSEWKRSGEGIELQVTFAVESCSMLVQTLPIVVNIEKDENNTATTKGMLKGCMKLYFASEGESVWEIGKKYRVPVENICEENDVSDDEILNRDTMLVLIS